VTDLRGAGIYGAKLIADLGTRCNQAHLHDKKGIEQAGKKKKKKKKLI
jgi:hypothetical protein